MSPAYLAGFNEKCAQSNVNPLNLIRRIFTGFGTRGVKKDVIDRIAHIDPAAHAAALKGDTGAIKDHFAKAMTTFEDVKPEFTAALEAAGGDRAKMDQALLKRFTDAEHGFKLHPYAAEAEAVESARRIGGLAFAGGAIGLPMLYERHKQNQQLNHPPRQVYR